LYHTPIGYCPAEKDLCRNENTGDISDIRGWEVFIEMPEARIVEAARFHDPARPLHGVFADDYLLWRAAVPAHLFIEELPEVEKPGKLPCLGEKGN
jgi:hypothetical protein